MSDSLVTKLTVKAYKDIKLQTQISSTNEFELQVNPQEISINFGIGFDGSKSSTTKKGIGTESNTEGAVGGNFTPRVFSGYKVPELQIDTLIDATGVLPAPKRVELVEDGQPSVRPYITLIKKVIYAWQSEEHGLLFWA